MLYILATQCLVRWRTLIFSMCQARYYAFKILYIYKIYCYQGFFIIMETV